MNREPLLQVRDLAIERDQDGRFTLDRVSIAVQEGEVLALIGESGSGKTTLALSALGWVRPGLAVSHGAVHFGGVDMLAADGKTLRGMRGHDVAYIAQSAAQSFNPRLRLSDQVIEPALVRKRMSRQDALARAQSLYVALGLPDPQRIGTRYPHQVSGGQLQRFMIAMALLLQPRLVVCDEPTSALDVTTQVGVLRALKAVIRDNGTAALFVSHDLSVVAQIADRIAVMRGGALVESGATADILERPREAYTRQLLAACRRWPASRPRQAERAGEDAPAYLQVRGIRASYARQDATGAPAQPALDDVSLTVGRGRILAVIGESGSGKSTLARVIAGLHPPSSGELVVEGETLAPALEARTRRQLQRIQLVFQSADTALNSQHTVGRILGRALSFFGHADRAGRQRRIEELLGMVKLPKHYVDRKPGQMSGGEKQRVNLARALAAEPDVLLCDEITSALDTVVAGSIVKLVEELRDRLNLAIIFISHDMATVSALANDVLVLRNGRVVEEGSVDQVLSRPVDSYTRLLLDSVPELRQGWLEDVTAVRSEVASA
ncbi:ABC transporter ATP-binding protein [Castellaniella sp.]|uniref:ABC transporter ATP-binding protein n=1 Tax=Castellaniella sp. TaxID=1955812 RepID=UPI003C74535A